MTGNRRVVHVDMDAFYAAVEQLDHPQYRGRPLIVGADPKAGRGRGVVSTASYEARIFGVHSAMPISQAYRLCPQAIYLPVRIAQYREISERILAIFQRYMVLQPVRVQCDDHDLRPKRARGRLGQRSTGLNPLPDKRRKTPRRKSHDTVHGQGSADHRRGTWDWTGDGVAIRPGRRRYRRG